MYPKLLLEDYHTLRHNYDNGKFDEHRITNAIAIFADAEHARDQKTRRSLDSIIVIMAGVLIDYKMSQQSCIALHSTDSEILSTFGATKKALFLYKLAKFTDLSCSSKPITIYQDSQPCIEIVESNTISSRVKHVAIPVLFTHENIVREVIQMEYIKTTLQPADPGTKPQSAPVLFRAYDYLTGVRFYPPITSEHAKLMDLPTFNSSRNFSEIAITTSLEATINTTSRSSPPSSNTQAPSQIQKLSKSDSDLKLKTSDDTGGK